MPSRNGAPETPTPHVIIARSPLRLSLGGGGTDLPSFYQRHCGFVIAAAIDRYVYVAVHEPFVERIILKYARTERVRSVDAIRHPIIREALRLVGARNRLEIASMSDIPAGTGLGSSGSFTTALLQVLHALAGNEISATALAAQACHIEIDRLGEPVGKQDPYIAAVGGITAFTIRESGEVEVDPLKLSSATVAALQQHTLLYFTGLTRRASSILGHQDTQTRHDDQSMIENLNAIKRIGRDIKNVLESGNLRCFGELMHAHWQYKRTRSPNMTNSSIDRCYEVARANGALGGKVVGAGGGGFLMLYSEDPERVRRAMNTFGLTEVPVHFDFAGAKVIARP